VARGRNGRLLWLSIATVYVFQALHMVIPADAIGGRYSWTASVVVGLFEAGLLVACAGLRRGATWAPRLAAWMAGLTGLVFLLYHGLPFDSAVTNPYPGEVGVAPWIPVVGIIAGALGTIAFGVVWSGAPDRIEAPVT
jgi:hypothetical protein